MLLRVAVKFGNTGCLFKVAVLELLSEINFIFEFPPCCVPTFMFKHQNKTFTTRESPTRPVKVTARHFELSVWQIALVTQKGGRTVPIKLSSLEVSDEQLGYGTDMGFFFFDEHY